MATNRDIDALIARTSHASAMFIQPKKDKDKVPEGARNAVPDIFLCKICGELPVEPHRLHCNCRGTLYCGGCIKATLSSDARCPSCRSSHQNAEALPQTDFGLQCLDSVNVECRGEGCGWFGTHEQAKQHTDSCALLRGQNNERCKKALAGSVLNLEQRNLHLQTLLDNQVYTHRQLSTELQSARCERDALKEKINEVEKEKEKSKDSESLQGYAKALEGENEELQEDNLLALKKADSLLLAVEDENKKLNALKEENHRLKEKKTKCGAEMAGVPTSEYGRTMQLWRSKSRLWFLSRCGGRHQPPTMSSSDFYEKTCFNERGHCYI